MRIHNVDLETQETSQWQKRTFPAEKVLIDTIVFSKGMELDNISLIFFHNLMAEVSLEELNQFNDVDLEAFLGTFEDE